MTIIDLMKAGKTGYFRPEDDPDGSEMSIRLVAVQGIGGSVIDLMHIHVEEVLTLADLTIREWERR